MKEINKIYNEDCLVGMKDIPDHSVDCIICDLPYGTTACKWDSIIPLDLLWGEYIRIIKDNGAICLFGQEPFSTMLRSSNVKMFRYDWIWQKQRPSNFQLMGYQCGRVHEIISVFSKSNACYSAGKPTMVYNPQTILRDKVRSGGSKIYGDTSQNILHNYKGGEIGTNKTYTTKQPTSILKFNTVEKNKLHPTQKPVELIEYLIRTYTNEGELVLDNCMGSGTTAVAAMRTGRNFIGFETDKNYFETSIKRIADEKNY